jgi:mannosyltransferase OCH1-like enzyme
MNINYVCIGPSVNNKKIVKLPKDINFEYYFFNNVPINIQLPNCNNEFSTSIDNNKLIVTRIDINKGWEQNLILSYSLKQNISEIPKNIYMCYKNLEDLTRNVNKWKILNPEYELKLYDDNMCKDFLLKEYNQDAVDIFDFLKDGPIKADFWRVCILYKYGGVYADADIVPILPLKLYIDADDDFVTCISGNFDKHKPEWQFTPQLIMSNKNDSILKETIDRYFKSYYSKKKYDYWSWSICRFMLIPGVYKKNSHILYKGNKKLKFLIEVNFSSCEYNGRLVLYNKMSNYKNHVFIN